MKKNLFSIIYIAFLLIFTVYVILDTFVISRSYDIVEETKSNVINNKNSIKTSSTSYEDDNIKITLNEYREYDTTIYVADIYVSDPSFLKTAFANNTYGKNVVNKTSSIANNVNAILAINGDYYGVQEKGYVLKNGVIYRNTKSNDQEDLVIYEDGTFKIINENEITLEKLLENGAYNILSFGPGLIIDNKISVSTTDEVSKSMKSNPRTAIGIIDTNHYVFVVSDGRTNESVGLSLYELATFMNKFGCNVAYNLDGGGSSTMYFNGNIVNKPTTMGNKVSERSVSDIVYIGYWYNQKKM